MTAGFERVRAAVAQAQPNIALIKYWGKRQQRLNLPLVGSLSITLDSIWTRTRVAFDPALKADRLRLNGESIGDDSMGATGAVNKPLRRVSACLDLLRERAGVSVRAQIDSRNNFPTGAGLASSASGFAALVTAAAAALGLELSNAEKSALARQGSGSAARSIFGGFVEWSRGEREDGVDSVARPVLDAVDWPLRVVIAITSNLQKLVGSTEGMNHTAQTSPYQRAWAEGQEADLAEARNAVAERDFAKLADISESSCLKMHALAMAARPGLLYWNGATVEGMQRVRGLRAAGVPVFFTIDAGPQLKAVCLPEAAVTVGEALRDIPGALDVIETGLGAGARVLDPHQALA